MEITEPIDLDPSSLASEDDMTTVQSEQSEHKIHAGFLTTPQMVDPVGSGNPPTHFFHNSGLGIMVSWPDQWCDLQNHIYHHSVFCLTGNLGV